MGDNLVVWRAKALLIPVLALPLLFMLAKRVFKKFVHEKDEAEKDDELVCSRSSVSVSVAVAEEGEDPEDVHPISQRLIGSIDRGVQTDAILENVEAEKSDQGASPAPRTSQSGQSRKRPSGKASSILHGASGLSSPDAGEDVIAQRRASLRSPMNKRRSELIEKLMANGNGQQTMMNNAVLSALPVTARGLLLEFAEELTLPSGTVLMSENDPSDFMFFITEGIVSIIKSGVEIARQEHGGVLGEMGIITGQSRTATVKCVGGETLYRWSDSTNTITEVRLLRISAAHFLRVTDCHPVMYRALLREMVDKVQNGTLFRINEFQCTQQVRVKQNHVIQDALDILTKTVSDEVLNLLMDDMSPVDLLKGRTDSAAILFFDIRGFSSAAEKMQPQELLQALNEHLQLITQQVQYSCGAIVNFIGDAVLAVFNTPVPIDFPADAALECYKNCRFELAEITEKRKKEGKVCFEMGGGLNFGLVVAGAIGSENRFTYSVLGDEVNLAARLESLTRHYPVDVIFSSALYQNLSDENKEECLLLDYVQVKGRSTPVYIYTILIQKNRLRRFNAVRAANIRRLGHHLSGEGMGSVTSSRRASLAAATATIDNSAKLSPIMRRANERLTNLESIARGSPIQQLQQFQQQYGIRRESAPPPQPPPSFSRERPGSGLESAPPTMGRDAPSAFAFDASGMPLLSTIEDMPPIPDIIGSTESAAEGVEQETHANRSVSADALQPPTNPQGVALSVSDGDVLQRTLTMESPVHTQMPPHSPMPTRRLPPLYEDTDITLFEQARDLYLSGKFTAALEMFRFAGGKLGRYFVERCQECQQQRQAWPGYYTWDVK